MENIVILLRPLKERELLVKSFIRLKYRIAICDEPSSDFFGFADYKIAVSSIRNEEEVFKRVVSFSKKRNILGVYTCLDYLLPVCARISEYLSLGFIDRQSAQIAFDKKIQKEVFKKAGINSSEFVYFSLNTHSKKYLYENLENLKFPVVIKPTDRTGSRGVFKVDHKDKFEYYLDLALKESWSDSVIIEEFIKGNEFSVEGFLFDDEFHMIGLTGKNKTVTSVFIEDSIYYPYREERDGAISELLKMLTRLHQAVNLNKIVTHVEIISNAQNYFVIELNARIGGGLIAEMVEKSSGTNLYMLQDALLTSKPLKMNGNPLRPTQFVVQSVIKHPIGRVEKVVVP